MFVKTTDLVAQKLTKKAISQSQWTLSNYSSLDKLSAASFLTPFPTKNPGYLALENNMRWNNFWILWNISSILCNFLVCTFLSWILEEMVKEIGILPQKYVWSWRKYYCFGFLMNRSAYRCTIEAQNTKKINKQAFPVPFIYFPYLKHKKKQFI